jgi:hypothetical protein
VTPVPVPVVIVVTPPMVVPPPATLVAEATTTVTVAPCFDLGDGIASSGETHHRHRDKNSSVPDLTATPDRQDSATDLRTGDEEKDDDDSLVCPWSEPQRERMAVGSSLPSR